MRAKSAVCVFFACSWGVLVCPLISQTAPSSRTPASAARPTRAQVAQALNPQVSDYSAREAQASPTVRAQLAALRTKVAESGATFSIRYTAAVDVPLAVLAGSSIPRNLPADFFNKVKARSKLLSSEVTRNSSSVQKAPGAAPNSCSATATHFDWRSSGKVTDVRTQTCGSCWDFTAMAAYEGSYAIQNSLLVDTSEQYELNCVGKGDCSGGWWMPVFEQLINSGGVDESQDPWTGNASLSCPNTLTPKYKASNWSFVGSSQSEVPSTALIKQAICDHGPVSTGIYADQTFQYYGGEGAFDEHSQVFDGVNHGITIIGWDDTVGTAGAWIIKNSWGPDWGGPAGIGASKGYAWVAYNTNNIGTATAWVDAIQGDTQLSPAWKSIMKNKDFDLRLTSPADHR